MKISKIKTMAAFTAIAMLLGGCGEAPYVLTESEEDIIVNYAAHVVTKFNADQKQGLAYVNMNAVESTGETETELQEDSEMPVVDEETAISPETGISTETPGAQMASLKDIFGDENIDVAYVGASLASNYIENSYYSVDADMGKTFLILEFSITNNGTEEAEVDNLTKTPFFQVKTADGMTVSSELTVLLEDFSAYQGSIPAGEAQKTVLLFQIPDTVTEVPEFSLSVNVSGTSYQIAL